MIQIGVLFSKLGCAELRICFDFVQRKSIKLILRINFLNYVARRYRHVPVTNKADGIRTTCREIRWQEYEHLRAGNHSVCIRIYSLLSIFAPSPRVNSHFLS